MTGLELRDVGLAVVSRGVPEWGRESPRDFPASNALPVFHGTGPLLRLAVNTINSRHVMTVERPSLRLVENGKFTQC
jgi:hypothetical protein